MMREGKTNREIHTHFPERTYMALMMRVSRVRQQGDPDIPRVQFSAEEDKQLVDAKAAGMTWREVWSLFPNVHRRRLYNRWQTLSVASGTYRRRHAFSETELSEVLHYRDELKMTFKAIATKMNRSLSSIPQAYQMISPNPSSNKVRGWTVEDTSRLRSMTRDGLSTKDIAHKLGRSPQAVDDKRRYFVDRNYFNTADSRIPWSAEEDRILRETVERGDKPTEIMELLPSRTSSSIKNRLHVLRHKA